MPCLRFSEMTIGHPESQLDVSAVSCTRLGVDGGQHGGSGVLRPN
jgi:hypothetical protein